MIKKCLILIILFLSLIAAPVFSQVMIYEIYAAGGNNSADYDNDFVVLYNAGTSPVTLGSYTLQYAPATSSNWREETLSGSIAAGGYYLIEIPTTVTNGVNIPSPDHTATVFANSGISATKGKLALRSSTISFDGTSDPTATPPADLEDFVGYGTANAAEGSTAPSPNSGVLYRTLGTDTGNNSVDFSRNTNLSSTTFPVELTFFKALLNKEHIDLVWQTSNEISNKSTEIQKSRNARSFETIGRINGQGDSDELNNYSFEDFTPFTGINYYRLKQNDFDGTVSYSKIIQVEWTSDNKYINIYPNPLAKGNTLNIETSDEMELNAVYNLQGQAKNGAFSVLNPGVYYLKFSDNSGYKISKKLFIK